MLLPVLIITVLLLVNAFFVVAEFAIVGVQRSAIDARASRHDRLARLVQGVLDDPRRKDLYIATAQIGITVASLGLGMYGEHVVADWILRAIGHSTWARVARGARLRQRPRRLDADLLPHRHRRDAAEVAGAAVGGANRALADAADVVDPDAALSARHRAERRRQSGAAPVRHPPRGAQRRTSTTPRRNCSSSSRSPRNRGRCASESSQVLQELFEFGELTAGEVMVPRVRITGIPVGAGPDDLREILGSAPRTRYPIYEGDLDHIVGTYHIKDLLRLLLNGQPVTAAGARPAPVVPETALLDAVLATMRRERAQFAVVIDEHGGTSGVVTLEDLFEEVVGEIDDSPERRSGPTPRRGRTAARAGHDAARRARTAVRSRAGPRGRGQRERPHPDAARTTAEGRRHRPLRSARDRSDRRQGTRRRRGGRHPTWIRGRRRGFDSVWRSTSRVTGAVSPSPNARNFSR